MKESRFIDQNKGKWADFEHLINNAENDPESISRLFVQITDDLSFARTFYRNRTVRKYLNGLSQTLFINLNPPKKIRFSDFTNFWKTSLPLMIYEARRDFLVSFIIFVIAMTIGMVSTANDPTFANLILGDDYVKVTNENINNGDPMGVFKKFVPFDGFLSITINNLLVATLTFVFGAFSAIGTIFIMLFNGVMVGTFQYFFIEQDLFRVSFLTIWQHGTLEISSIIIAGGAGLTMGNGLLFPGTFSRLQSFRISARRGLKILIGIFPVIIVAGFIEAFLTRYTELPDIIRLGFILLSLAFVITYYVWYPFKLAKKQNVNDLKKETLEFVPIEEIDFYRVYSNEQLFENTITLFRSLFKYYFRYLIGLLIVYAFVLGLLFSIDLIGFVNSSGDIISGYGRFFHYEFTPMLFPVNIVMYALLFLLFIFPLSAKKIKSKSNVVHQPLLRLIFAGVFNSVVINLLLLTGFFPGSLFAILVFPFLTIISFVFVNQQINFFGAMVSGIKLVFRDFLKPMSLYLKFGILLFFILFSLFPFLEAQLTPLLIYIEISPDFFPHVKLFFDAFLFFLFYFFGIGILISAFGLAYFSIYETITADNLKQRIEKLGQKTKILGYERE